MRLNPTSSGTKLESPVFLYLILGNLIFSAIFLMSMGAQVVKSGSNKQQSVQTNPAPEKEQKLVTLAQIN